MARQLTFDLPVRPALGREDFFVSAANAEALAALDGWAGWPAARLALIGHAGAGKTHLAHVWAAETGARILPAGALRTGDIARHAATPLALEDIDRGGVDDTALFHLLNAMAEAGRPLLLTARAAPARRAGALADLKSRLDATPLARLAPPDDALLGAVVLKLFADRQLAVTPALIPYLLRRIDRSFAAAAAVVARLDAAALAERRPITPRFAGQVLDKPETGGA